MCGFCSLVYLFLFYLLFCFGMSQRIPIRVLVKRLTVTTQIWIMTRHQYGISELVPQTSFPGETSCRVAKYRRSYQANFLLEDVCPRGINKVRSTTPFRSHRTKMMCAANLTQEILNIACNIHHTP